MEGERLCKEPEGPPSSQLPTRRRMKRQAPLGALQALLALSISHHYMRRVPVRLFVLPFKGRHIISRAYGSMICFRGCCLLVLALMVLVSDSFWFSRFLSVQLLGSLKGYLGPFKQIAPEDPHPGKAGGFWINPATGCNGLFCRH